MNRKEGKVHKREGSLSWENDSRLHLYLRMLLITQEHTEFLGLQEQSGLIDQKCNHPSKIHIGTEECRRNRCALLLKGGGRKEKIFCFRAALQNLWNF